MSILQIERANDHRTAIDTALDALAAELWVALPGIVQTVGDGVVSVLPTIEMLVTKQDDTEVSTQMPVIVDCPVVYMGGGGFVATFPIQPGDEALVIFADRCIDGWWQSGKVSPQSVLRMHSLSDGFALIGPRSQLKAIPNISTSSAQLRSLDGSTYIEIAGGHVVNIVAPTGLNITGPVNIDGDLAVTGTTAGAGNISAQGTVTATGDGTFNGHSVSNHVHSGVQPGGSNTEKPVG